MPFKLDRPELLELTKSTKLLDEVDALCKKCAAAGFDVTAQDLASQALRERINAIREQFGPKVKE